MQIPECRALVFGSTGLTGKILAQKLLADNSFSHVKIFVRKKTDLLHSKLEQVVIDFDVPFQIEKELKGDILFCCLGTTIKKAGSKEAFQEVDMKYPFMLAEIAAKNKVKSFLMMSSLGADKRSSNFYLRTKGYCEEKISYCDIERIYFFRPSMLLGERTELRMGEVIGKFFMKLFSFALAGKYKKYNAVKAETVADCMIHYALHETSNRKIVENDEILSFNRI